MYIVIYILHIVYLLWGIFPMKLYNYPTRKTFAMWKIARIGQGNHKKAWKQEIRREHNSNPLQRQSHVLVVFPANMPRNFYWWSDDHAIPIYLLYIHFGMFGHTIMMICDELMFLIHAVLSTGIHTVHPCVVTCTDRTGDLHGMMWWIEAGRWIWNTVYYLIYYVLYMFMTL